MRKQLFKCWVNTIHSFVNGVQIVDTNEYLKMDFII